MKKNTSSIIDIFKGAEHRYAKTKYNPETMCQNDELITSDRTEDISLYLQAAEEGNALAQLWMGWMYRHGIGVSKDDTEAVKWYKKSAHQENADAQALLGFMYGTGQGVQLDYVEAVKWY